MEDIAREIESRMVEMLSTNETSVMKKAEEGIKGYLSKKNVSSALILILEKSSNEGARQMAGNFLRAKLVSFWNKQTPDNRQSLKLFLLSRLAQETNRSVRLSIIGCIAVLAKAIMPGGNWPELMQLMQEALVNPSVDARELGLLLLRELCETLGRRIGEFSSPIRDLIGRGLSDSALPVRSASLGAFSSLVTHLETAEEHEFLVPLFPLIMSVAESSLVEGADEAGLVQVFDVLSDLVESWSPLVRTHAHALTRFLLSVLRDEQLEFGTRDAAASVLQTLFQTAPRVLERSGLLPEALETLLYLCSAYDPDEEDARAERALAHAVEVSDFDDESVWASGMRLLDALALAMRARARALLDVLFPLAQRMLSSNEWKHRFAALVALGVVSEGCSAGMQANLAEVLRVVAPFVSDPSAHVRTGLCHCLALFSIHLSPRILRFHSLLLPLLFQLLGDAEDRVLEQACRALDCFLRSFSQQNNSSESVSIGSYLGIMMDGISALLGRADLSLPLREHLVTATGSVALAAGSLFQPYALPVSEFLLRCIGSPHDEELRLRASAVRALGTVVRAVGAAGSSSFMNQALSAAAAQLQLDMEAAGSLELREATLSFFGEASHAIGQTPEFLALLPELVPLLLDTATSSEGIVLHEDGSDDEDADQVAFARDAAEDEEADEDESTDGEVNLRVRTSWMELKAVAVDSLGQIIGCAGPHIQPYLARCASALETLLAHFDDGVKYAAVHALIATMRALVAAFPPVPLDAANGSFAAAAGEVRNASTHRLHPQMSDFYGHLLTELCLLMRNDPDKESVSHACATVGEWCALLGQLAVNNHLDAVVNALLRILSIKARCMLDDPDDIANDAAVVDDGEDEEDPEEGKTPEEEAEEEKKEHDVVVTDEAVDALVAVLRAAGPLMAAKHLPKVVLELLKYAKPGRAPQDRLLALGAIGELVEGLGESFSPHVPAVVPAFLFALQIRFVGDEIADKEVIRNACYGVGALAQHCPAASAPFLDKLVGGLAGVLANATRPDSASTPVSTPISTTSSTSPSTDSALEEERRDLNALVDNAVSALIRAALLHCHSPLLPVPLSHVLKRVLPLLPLRVDHAEDSAVYNALSILLQQLAVVARDPAALTFNAHSGELITPADVHPQALAAAVNLPAIISALATALSPSSGSQADVAAGVANTLKVFKDVAAANQPLGQALTAALNALPQDLQSGLVTVLA